MDVRRYSFLSLSIIALGALSNVASSAPPGSAVQQRLSLKARVNSGPIALQHSSVTSVNATSNVATPTLIPLANQLPNGITFTLLLTDGTVMAQDGTYYNQWWKLTPDIDGSYLNGTWTQLASLPVSYSPYASAEAVLADGRVVVIGGEYSGPNSDFTLTNEGAIYDPRTDTWTALAPPPGFNNIGDSPATVLPDGRFLLGQKITKEVSALDPRTLRWKNLKSKDKNDFNAEEGWTLLPDGSVLTLDVLDAPKAEAYSTSGQKWDHLRDVPADLHSPTTVVGCIPYGPAPDQCYYPPGEIGPAILRPDGTVFATGSYANADPTFSPASAGHTAIYDTHTGTWTQGPDFPINLDTFCFLNCQMVGDNAGDSFAALLPNGKVLVEGLLFGYEFDGTQFATTLRKTLDASAVFRRRIDCGRRAIE